jgi:NADH:ubiquinone reductase (non-electrogenic)
MAQFPSVQTNRRGLTVDGHLRVSGTDGVFALGDCTATSYAPTAQVASQQGAYLAKLFNKMAKKDSLVIEKQLLDAAGVPEDGKAEVATKLEAIGKQLQKLENPRAFHYSHQGSLAYIGSERAIADLPFMNGTVSPIFSSSGSAERHDSRFPFSSPLVVLLLTTFGGVPTLALSSLFGTVLSSQPIG